MLFIDFRGRSIEKLKAGWPNHPKLGMQIGSESQPPPTMHFNFLHGGISGTHRQRL